MKAADPDYLLGHEIYSRLVRGDAVVGLVSNVGAMQREMLDALWRSALRGDARAYERLASCYYSRLIPIGAFEGVDAADHLERSWSTAAARIEDEDFLPLQAALRCHYEAARLGDRHAATAFAQAARDSNRDNQELALRLLLALDAPSADEIYRTALVHHWLGNFVAAAELHHVAASAGSHDAEFELYIYYAQGIGVEKNEARSQDWLQRAADGDHPRALYNLGGACVRGAAGEPDFVKAADYYTRAARHGNGRAAATLGYMILNEEIDGTEAQAIEWLNLADESGYPSWELLATAGIEDPRRAEH